MVDILNSQPSPLQEADFDRAFERLQALVDLEAANQLFVQRAHTVYTACVVLWMLVYQRLKPDASLENAVKHLIETRPDYLPDNKRLSENRLSLTTGAYSAARTRLPLEVVKWFANEVSTAIIATTDPSVDQRRAFLIDGTTFSLAPETELQLKFPPGSNQHGEGVWPIALATVFHELSSGCALPPEVGPMYGADAISETALARRGLVKLPPHSIVMGDTGFGIFGVVYDVVHHGHDALFRVKTSNFEALRKQATLISQSERHKTYQVTWIPTKANRQTYGPQLPPDASVDVFLHEVVVNESLTLLLVTTLTHDAWTLAELFKCRYDVEVDIRNFKVILDAENIRAKSMDLFLKELYTSVVAYNLTSQFRREAAKLAQLPPRRLSFKRVWTTFQTFLLRHLHTDAASWRAAFIKALRYATQDKLPNRPGRAYKRENYRKAAKNSHFPKKEKRPEKPTTPNVN